MRTIALLFLLTLFNWNDPQGVGELFCEMQEVALFRVGVPLIMLLLVLDVLNLVARQLERRQRREKADNEWLENWVERLIKTP